MFVSFFFVVTNNQPEMTTIELLAGLEEDGKHYAHFLTNAKYPGYYGILIRERTPEFIHHWLPESDLKDYKLAFSFEMNDMEFRDYMLEQYTDQIPVKNLKAVCRIDNVNNPQQWIKDFKAYKQQSILNDRTRILEQYPWVTTPYKTQSTGHN